MNYITPQWEIIHFESEDILITSVFDDDNSFVGDQITF